jgi:hypothetical protein
MKKKIPNYSKISSLKELQFEKALLQNDIRKKELLIAKNWGKVSEFWRFLPQMVIQSISAGKNVISWFRNLFSKKKDDAEEVTTPPPSSPEAHSD